MAATQQLPEAPFSVSVKLTGPSGAEQLMTFRPEVTTLEEQIEAIQEIDHQMKELIAGGFSVPSPPYSRASSGGGQQRQQAPQQADPEGRVCGCGQTRVVKTGNGRKGAWKGYFCPNRKCDPVWEN